MTWVAISCPQCSAPLPRVALWRAVKCPSCGSLIARTEAVVTRDSFRQALLRAREDSGAAGGSIECGGERYHLLQSFGGGEISEVYLAQRLGALPMLATVKLSSSAKAGKRFAREAQVLQELGATDGAAGAFFAHCLPQVATLGAVDGESGRQALILHHPNGFWGSLAALCERFPSGLDPRHTVWIWRRLLDVLGVIHGLGWCHGDVRPEHALVHPQDHAVRLIGWGSAEKGASASAQAKDLMRSARVALVLVSGAKGTGAVPKNVPSELAELITQAGEDESFCRTQRAAGLDALLRSAAQAAFGPPAFVPLTI